MRHIRDENCPHPTPSETHQDAGRKALLILVGLVALLLLGAFLGVARAQTVNRKATLNWTAPTTCSGGSAITNCPIKGYSVQKLIGSTWTEIGTTTAAVLTYTDSNLAIGTHSYRVLANSDAGPSGPSNTATKTIDVPGAPGNITITVTVDVTVTP